MRVCMRVFVCVRVRERKKNKRITLCFQPYLFHHNDDDAAAADSLCFCSLSIPN